MSMTLRSWISGTKGAQTATTAANRRNLCEQYAEPPTASVIKCRSLVFVLNLLREVVVGRKQRYRSLIRQLVGRNALPDSDKFSIVARASSVEIAKLHGFKSRSSRIWQWLVTLSRACWEVSEDNDIKPRYNAWLAYSNLWSLLVGSSNAVRSKHFSEVVSTLSSQHYCEVS